ncbi:MAG: hypothetical protein QME25_08615 [Bacteroidota bacterium]|nr:hypothetical protein [Bacteroidota bacterium]
MLYLRKIKEILLWSKFKITYGIKRLESKNAKNAIIQKLAQDFNLTPIIAEAFYKQVSIYFSEHSNISLSSGEVSYEAVSSDEPAGKHIRLTRKVTVKLRLMDINSDFEESDLQHQSLLECKRNTLQIICKTIVLVKQNVPMPL